MALMQRNIHWFLICSINSINMFPKFCNKRVMYPLPIVACFLIKSIYVFRQYCFPFPHYIHFSVPANWFLKPNDHAENVNILKDECIISWKLQTSFKTPPSGPLQLFVLVELHSFVEIMSPSLYSFLTYYDCGFLFVRLLPCYISIISCIMGLAFGVIHFT